MRRCARRLVHVHAGRRTSVTAIAQPGPRHALAVRAAARAVGRPRRPASRRSASRSASRSMPIPPFVGPVLAAHIDEFGRYPMNKGLDEFCAAAAALARPALRACRARSIRRPRCWSSTARARACSSAAIAAERWVNGRRRPPGDPDAQSVLRRLCGRRGRRRTASRSICRPPPRPASCPTSMRSTDELLARTVAFYLASPANPQGAVAERGLSRAAGRRSRAASASWCSATNATPRSIPRHAPPGMLEACRPRLRQRRGVPVAVEALEPARPARRLCRRRPQVPRPLPRAAQRRRRRRCRCRRSGSPSRPTATKPHVEENRGSTRRNSISPTRSSATATATGGRPAASSSGSTSPRMAATRP